MSMADLQTMFIALSVRRGKPPEISDEEKEAGMALLLAAVKDDPNVRLN